jgi:uncharacterized membrane protein YjfL (UPF0719 family)
VRGQGPAAQATATADAASTAAAADAGAGVATGTGAGINLARGLSRAGMMVGLTLLAGVVVDGVVREAGGWQAGLRWGGAYAAVGIVLLLATGALVSRAFLGGRMRAELARGNVAAGLVAAGHFVAVGWIMESCFFGRDLRSLTVSGLFFLIGVATLIVLQVLYRALTHYADDQEVVGENAAAALAFVGVTLALAIIIAHAAEGAFVGWARSLRGYGLALLLALALYPVRQLVVGPLLLGLPARMRGGALDQLVAEERRVAVGGIEALAYIAMALLATAIG